MTIRRLDLADIKNVLIDPTKALALCPLTGSSHITTNDGGLIEVIEEVIIPSYLNETLNEWIDEDIVHFDNKETLEDKLCTSQYCEIWRDSHGSQPTDAAKAAAKLGLV